LTGSGRFFGSLAVAVVFLVAPAAFADPDAPIKLDASSKSSLAASIPALSPGRRGWISMKDAVALFSAKDADYAF
jgi:hypothetical protein